MGSLLIASGGSIPLLCLQGVPDLPSAPQDEAGLTRKFGKLGVALESLQGLRDLT